MQKKFIDIDYVRADDLVIGKKGDGTDAIRPKNTDAFEPGDIIQITTKIDGANEYRIFIQIILPLLKSGLATIGLFLALGYWNDWYNAMLYMNTDTKFPLQYMLYNLLQQTQALARIASQAGIVVADLPSNSLKMAMAVVATGPIILVYPFVQKYFVAGITVGSVKG